MSAPNNDVDSFSSDSEDEFLTTMRDDGNGGNVDREALIRKKLLESFYGKTAAENQENDNDSDDDSSGGKNIRKRLKPPSRSASHDTYDEDDSDDDSAGGRRGRRVDPIAAADLDSPYFDAAKHTEDYVLHSGVHPLLETEESLACQVRTLDSSMQTLVYENYSRFIEATDAIRSIGVNVQANSSNLQKLSTSMESVGETARSVENSCGALRDSVVEKLRVKRLLQRLDALLKLPSTLKENINAGRYRWASKSYLTAYNILSKHSAGFESLQRIEVECYNIMETLLADIRRKLLHWSGSFILEDDNSDHLDDAQEGDGEKSRCNRASALEDPPDPPQSVAEIFECAGTAALMLMNHRQKASNPGSDESAEAREIVDRPATITRMASRVDFDPGLTIEEIKDTALSACLRLLERDLDMHHIELQDSKFVSEGVDGLAAPGGNTALPSMGDLVAPSLTSSHPSMDGSQNCKLIPTNVLDGILEASTLYSMTFYSDGTEKSEKLARFVSTSFESFLQNVKSELLDQLQQASSDDSKYQLRGSLLDGKEKSGNPEESTDDDICEEQVEADERAYKRITNATSLLVESARQLSSGLSLPEVAMDLVIASELVERSVGLSESMVRKRVDQKFSNLRFRVIRNCLAPFCRKVCDAAEKVDDELQVDDTGKLAEAVQMGGIALSDSLQLIDDTIRSVLSPAKQRNPHGSTSSLASAEDVSMLKAAVQESSTRFAIWFASVLETLAGCELSELHRIVDIRKECAAAERAVQNAVIVNCRGALGDDDEQSELIEELLFELLDELEIKISNKADLSLAIVEMCRLAQSSVSDDITASIATHTGSLSKQRTAKAGLFATLPDGSQGEHSNPIADRFHLASSRVLNLYATNRGHEAASSLVADYFGLSQEDITETVRPRPSAWALLALLKDTCIECSALFGGPKRGGPIPGNLEDEYVSLTMSKQHKVRTTGLAFDVERMFAEKVVVYPNSFEYAGLDRNSVVYLVMKVALKSLLENSRNIRFSVAGYRQYLVDIEFLKFLLPHYVENNFLADGSNPLTILQNMMADASICAKERCDGSALLQDNTTEINRARAAVRSFLSDANSKDMLFLIADDIGVAGA